MESDLLPLMEIAEEDDSLIQLHPDRNQTPSKSSGSYFPCSPFALPPSHSKSLKDCVNTEKHSSSSSEASNNKENVNLNKGEVSKLGIERMQMKRRKKGDVCNLRKSLAWDRAFFTDEGILDPLELTLITGINANTCGRRLPTISEEGSSSCSSNTKCINGPNDTKAVEEVLRKKLDEKRCTSKGNREKAGGSEGNHDSLPHHKVTHRILPIDRKNGAVSKVGSCSVPLAASSLKRPTYSNTLDTTNKEYKLPKLPMSNPGSCFSVTTKGSMSACQLRHTSTPKPTINIKKNDVLKSSIKNVQGSLSKAKKGSGIFRLPVKERAKKTASNMTKVTSSTKSREVLADNANSGSERVPDRLKLCEIQEGSAPIASKNLVQRPATDLNNFLPATTSLLPCQIQRTSSGLMMSDKLHPCEGNISYTGAYPTKIQYSKPSGLRLPSPSLRFFDQKSDMGSGSLQKEVIQQHNTNMGFIKRNNEMTPPVSPTNITGNVRSAPITLSIYNHLGNTIEGVTSSEVDVHTVIEQGKKILGNEDAVEMKKDTGNGDMEMNLSYPTEQLGEDNGAGIHLDGNAKCINNVGVAACHPTSQSHNERVALVPEMEGGFVRHNEEDMVLNHTAISTSASGQSGQHQEHNTLTAFDGSTNLMQDLAQTSIEQDDTEKSDVPNVSPESHLHANSLDAEEWASEVSLETRKDTIGKKDDIGATKWDSTGLESNSTVLQREYIGQENDVAKLVNDAYRSSNIALKGTLTRLDPSHIPFQDMNAEQENGVAKVQLEFQEHPLNDGYNHVNLPNPRPEVELIVGIASSGDDACFKSESVMEVAQCAHTYPKSLKEEGVDTTEIEANPINGSTGFLETYNQFQSENQTLEASGTVNNFPEMETLGEDETVGVNNTTCMEHCSTGVESSSFQRKDADSILKELPTLFGAFFDIGQGSENNDYVIMDSLSPEMSADLETPTNVSDSIIVVLEQSGSHGCALQASQDLSTVQGNTSDFNGQSGYVMEFSDQDPLKTNLNFPVSEHPTTGVKSPSTISNSVSGELCLGFERDKSLQKSIGDERSNISLGEELETEVIEGKSSTMADFHHELDGESDLKNNKNATALIRSNNIKRQDNSLVIHPPNAVPFSDEWLAAIEAAGEEILTLKCGAVQHSPTDKSLPEPGPWSPVKKKANQIGPYDCTKYTNVLQPDQQ